MQASQENLQRNPQVLIQKPECIVVSCKERLQHLRQGYMLGDKKMGLLKICDESSC